MRLWSRVIFWAVLTAAAAAATGWLIGAVVAGMVVR